MDTEMANEAQRADARRGVLVPEASAEAVVHLLPVASAPERPRRRQPHLLVPVVPFELIGFTNIQLLVPLPVLIFVISEKWCGP